MDKPKTVDKTKTPKPSEKNLVAEKKFEQTKTPSENVEIFEDDEIITLFDDNDNPVDFYEVACVELEENFYSLLQPVKPLEGIGEDEVVIFRLEEQDDETDLFLPLDDEALLQRVFEQYMRMVADEEV